MYLRVTRTHYDPAQHDAVTAMVGGLVDAIRQLAGCQDVLLGGDRTTGTAISVATFDTLAHAQFPRESVGSSLLATARDLGIQIDAPEFYQIIS